MGEMKRFAVVEDREFEVGGEVFKWRYPHWEEMAAIYDEDVALLRNRNGKEDEEELTTKDAIERTIERIAVFLDGAGAKEKWRKLAARKTDPLPLHQFGDIYRWLLEVTSGRPTMPPSASEPGGGSTEASSQAGSP